MPPRGTKIWKSFQKKVIFITFASLALAVIAEVEICYADYAGTVVSYNVPNSITQGESLPIYLEVQNNGTETWTAYYETFPPKYLPSYKVIISDMSWQPSSSYGYAQMYHVYAGETDTFTKELLQELPSETGDYSFTIECRYHTAYSSDIYDPMNNSPIQVTFSIVPTQAQALPDFKEDFESAALAAYWTATSTGAGRIQVTDAHTPAEGSYHVVMDSGSSGVDSLNELVLTVALASYRDVTLSFYHKDFGDEDHEMSDSFVGSENSDGVAISADGVTWYKVQGLTSADGISSDWQRYSVDLDAAIAAAGVSYNDSFKIKFQQFGQNSNGFAFDDIAVEVIRYWGVFVGISDYQSINDLDFAADDATSIYNLFLQDSRWDASRMTLLRNSQASRSAVEDAITAMASNSDDNDICLFFFSGHGGRANEDFIPEDESDGRDEYLSCWDSNDKNYTGDFLDDDMGDSLGQISGTTVVMLDTCHSGGHIKAALGKSASGKIQKSQNIKCIKKSFEKYTIVIRKKDGFASDLVDKVPTLKDADDQSEIIVLTASDYDELSTESSELSHGLFTYFLLLGLKSNDVNSNGSVSAEEAFLYLKPALIEYNKNNTEIISPQSYDDTIGEVDLLKPTAERLLFIGHGAFDWTFPFNTYFRKRRAEYIYTQSQLGQGGHIKSLKIFVEENPPMPLENCTIRMKHTSASEYDSSPQWTSSGWTTVYAKTKTINNFGPTLFTLSTPFYYDGVNNLIIDFSFSNSDWQEGGLFTGSYSEKYCMIYHATDNDNYGEPVTWTGTSPQPVRDENESYAGSYLDLELEFCNIEPYAGDINNDRKINIDDAIVALKIFVGIDPITVIYKDADANGDGKIGIEEAIFVLQKIVNEERSGIGLKEMDNGK